MKKYTLAFILIIIFILSGCHYSDQALKKKMIEIYTDDQKYISLCGKIVELEENVVFIKCKELSAYISYQTELCWYRIYSDYALNLTVGDEIEFITAPYHLYDGHKLPIVQINKGTDVLLPFDEGKENLIEWVNTTFN